MICRKLKKCAESEYTVYPRFFSFFVIMNTFADDFCVLNFRIKKGSPVKVSQLFTYSSAQISKSSSMHPVIFLISCLKHCITFLREVADEMPEYKKKEFLDSTCMFSNQFKKDYEEPLQAILNCKLSDLWLQRFTMPAVRDFQGMLDIVITTVLAERDRRQAFVLRDYSLRWNVAVRLWRIAQMKKRLLNQYKSFQHNVFTELDRMSAECESEYPGEDAADVIGVQDLSENIGCALIKAETTIEDQFDFL